VLKTSESQPAPQGDDRGALFLNLFGIGGRGARPAGDPVVPDVDEPTAGAAPERPGRSGRLSAVSHEIRAPLQGMRGMAEMLAAGEPSAHRRRLADVIARSASALIWNVNDGLDAASDAAVELVAGAVDLAEGVLTAVAVPLALAAAGVFAVVRGL